MNNFVFKNVRPFADGKFGSPVTMNVTGGKWVGETPEAALTVDARGAYAMPALFALGMDFKEPARDDVYTFRDGFRAMRLGGFSGGLYESPANPIDGIQKLSAVEQVFARSGLNMRPLGAISEAYNSKALAEMMELSEGGAVGFGDGNRNPGTPRFLRLALEYGAMTHKRFFFLPINYSLCHGAQVHEGVVADTLGMKGSPRQAETIALFELLELALWLKIPMHFKQITCAESLGLIAHARARGLDVTCDVDVHHLLFDENDLFGLDPNLNLHPPIRTSADREALWNGLESGAIQAVSANHTPVLRQDKEVNFEDAVPGAVSLETFLPAIWAELSKRVGDARAVELLSQAPARVAGTSAAELAFGKASDFVLFDPSLETEVAGETFSGQVRNSPFPGRRLKGKILGSCIGGTWTSRG